MVVDTDMMYVACKDPNQVVEDADLVDKIYWLRTTQRSVNVALRGNAVNIHARMGHAPVEVLRKMVIGNMSKDAKNICQAEWTKCTSRMPTREDGPKTVLEKPRQAQL